MKKRILTALPVLLLLAFVFYTSDYYRADEQALEALNSEIVSKTDYGWFFDGPESSDVLLFYPGAKVEETAYAPMLLSLAESGLDVCLIKVPFHLAVFGINRADAVLGQIPDQNVYIGGHSLGGAMAAYYASSHDLDGVMLFAAYPTKKLDEPVLIIYGTEDLVLNMEKVNSADQFGAVDVQIVDGGNHAQFGNYGIQKGDGEAKIPAWQQQRETTERVMAWLREK